MKSQEAQACDPASQGRAAKVKCDGKLPACTACEKAGRETECSAANDQFARGKERSYVAALELRVEKLERRLAYARSRKASVATHDPDVPPLDEQGRKDSLANIRAAIHRKAARKRENSDVNSLVSDFGYLSVEATTQDFDPTNMTFARLVLAASTNDPLPDPQTTKLPARQAAYAIIQFYLSNIYPLYPAFSDTALLAIVDDLYQEDPRTFRSPEHWLFWMVLAIGSMAQSRSRQDEYYRNGLEFVARALLYADRALRPGFATQIQSLLLLTQFSMLDPAHFDSWHLIGFTCRAAVDLGFHQDTVQMHSLDKTVLDARRKTFRCVYALDRAISMVHARAFSFTDDAISVGSPSVSTGSFMSGLSGSPSVHLFELRRLQSNWYQTLFQCDPTDLLPDATSFVWQMCSEMRRWSESLPENLPIGFREMFDLELRYSYVYCIAPSARAPHMTAYGRMLIFEHAIAYIDRTYDVANAATNTAFYTYHDALRVYFMGSQFVAVLRDAGDSLLSGSIVPIPLSLPEQALPPPLPKRYDPASGGDNLDRSLRALERVSLSLKKYGDRWEDALALMDSFETMSGGVMESLKARRNMRDMAVTLPGQAQSQMSVHPLQPTMTLPHRRPLHQHMPQPAPAPQEMRWVDVNVAQMRRGGNQA
ncbi:fungal-specific transcription factor domain-containing protein [Cercophora scortea]|uniref:Fungal-specific transcription factor domain-containing protein n=1 Tax=Cercophora scortea TaxID=314031 RepID=A0AAE0IFP9_9PEZI|nr:fungal-specific transcription factor domain-containing protein [Cercophora scortea]